MSWRYFGRARADSSRPTAAGYCDRCGMVYQLSSLQWEVQYRGTGLARTGFRVCSTCLDIPNPQFKAIVLPADPVPVRDPRPGDVNAQMDNAYQPTTWDFPQAQWDSADSTWDFS